MIEPADAREFDEEDVLVTEVTDAMLEAACTPELNGAAFSMPPCTLTDCGS